MKREKLYSPWHYIVLNGLRKYLEFISNIFHSLTELPFSDWQGEFNHFLIELPLLIRKSKTNENQSTLCLAQKPLQLPTAVTSAECYAIKAWGRSNYYTTFRWGMDSAGAVVYSSFKNYRGKMCLSTEEVLFYNKSGKHTRCRTHFLFPGSNVLIIRHIVAGFPSPQLYRFPQKF